MPWCEILSLLAGFEAVLFNFYLVALTSMVLVPSHARKNMITQPSKLLSIFWTRMDT
jgi:hypothetical protein